MNKTIFLHIGTFKTGTTSIQAAIKKNKRRLEKKGVYIPGSMMDGHHELPISLLREVGGFDARWAGYDNVRNWRKIWDKLIKEIENTALPKIVVSSEFFCDFYQKQARKNIGRLKKILNDYLSPYDIKVVCYLRDILPYAKSMYQEIAKSSSLSIGYKKFIEEAVKEDSIHIRPSGYLNFYKEVFGERSLLLLEYNKSILRNGDVVADFFHLIGGDFECDENETYRKNQSLSDHMLEIKKAMNVARIESRSYNLMLSKKLLEIDQETEKQLNDDALEELLKDEYAILKNDYNMDFQNKTLGIGKDAEPGYDIDHRVNHMLLAHIIKQNKRIIELLEKRDD